MSDNINPDHYALNAVQPIELIENLPYLQGTAIKYLTRAGLKPGQDVRDELNKTVWYVQRLALKLGVSKVNPVEHEPHFREDGTTYGTYGADSADENTELKSVNTELKNILGNILYDLVPISFAGRVSPKAGGEDPTLVYDSVQKLMRAYQNVAYDEAAHIRSKEVIGNLRTEVAELKQRLIDQAEELKPKLNEVNLEAYQKVCDAINNIDYRALPSSLATGKGPQGGQGDPAKVYEGVSKLYHMWSAAGGFHAGDRGVELTKAEARISELEAEVASLRSGQEAYSETGEDAALLERINALPIGSKVMDWEGDIFTRTGSNGSADWMWEREESDDFSDWDGHEFFCMKQRGNTANVKGRLPIILHVAA